VFRFEANLTYDTDLVPLDIQKRDMHRPKMVREKEVRIVYS